MRVLDLFSGIGGFSLGLERAGMETVAFCEIDEFCRRVLKKHWPDVPCYDDVRTLTADTLRRDGIAVDVICGGFPCQDLSIAQGASRAGLDGERSGLWSDYARLVRELRPRFVIVENVTGLLSLGIRDVLGDLASCGYAAEWQVISAAAVGAPHIRDRVWLVGYPHGDGEPALTLNEEMARLSGLVADTDSTKLRNQSGWRGRASRTSSPQSRDDGPSRWWSTQPGICRMDDGVPSRVDRLRSLGNAVVPQIPELIGRAIMEAV